MHVRTDGLYGGQKCEGMLYERGGSEETTALDRGQHAGPSPPRDSEGLRGPQRASEGPDMMSQSPAPPTEPRSLVPETLAGIGLNSQFGALPLVCVPSPPLLLFSPPPVLIPSSMHVQGHATLVPATAQFAG